MTTKLFNKSCRPCEDGMPPLKKEAETLLEQLIDWILKLGTQISKTFQFKNFYQTISFVNAAWIVYKENHHPDLKIGYNRCCVCFTTHSIQGLSENDFICAAKIDQFM